MTQNRNLTQNCRRTDLEVRLVAEVTHDRVVDPVLGHAHVADHEAALAAAVAVIESHAHDQNHVAPVKDRAPHHDHAADHGKKIIF